MTQNPVFLDVGGVPIALTGTFLAGVGIPLCVVAFSTMRQRLTPPDLQGRVAAATGLALNGPQTFGTAAGAALISVVDYRVMLAVMAAVIGACALAALDRRSSVAPASVPVQPSEV